MKSSIRIISDDVVFYSIFTPLLKHEIPDIEIIICRNHEDIFKNFDSENCNLILVDGAIPGISTLEVIQFLRLTKKIKIPIWFFPNIKTDSFSYKAKSIGASRLIFKPYDPYIVASEITNMLKTDIKI